MVLDLLFTSTIKETVSWFTEHFTPNIFLLSVFMQVETIEVSLYLF